MIIHNHNIIELTGTAVNAFKWMSESQSYLPEEYLNLLLRIHARDLCLTYKRKYPEKYTDIIKHCLRLGLENTLIDSFVELPLPVAHGYITHAEYSSADNRVKLLEWNSLEGKNEGFALKKIDSGKLVVTVKSITSLRKNIDRICIVYKTNNIRPLALKEIKPLDVKRENTLPEVIKYNDSWWYHDVFTTSTYIKYGEPETTTRTFDISHTADHTVYYRAHDININIDELHHEKDNTEH